MTRLAAGRTTHLTEREIADEVLRQFDASTDGTEPSIRAIAAGLRVTPKAVYHYFDTRSELVQAAVALVWEEVVRAILGEIADPVASVGDPERFFVVAATSTRSAFADHYQIARHIADAPDGSTRLSGALAIISTAFEQLGLGGDDAGRAFHAYSTFLLGAVLLDATRRINADERAARGERLEPVPSLRDVLPADAPAASDETLDALDDVVSGNRARKARDQLFEESLRLLLASFRTSG